MRTAVVTLFPAILLVCCGADGGRSQDKSIYPAQAGCDGLGEFCEGGGLCCSGMFCGGSNCCIAEGQTCHAAADCCSGDCSAGRCSASPIDRWCDSSADCAGGLVCDIGPGFCQAPTGGHCRSANDCITATCLQGTCGCGSDADSCASDADCCSGLHCYGDGAVNGRNIGNFCQ